MFAEQIALAAYCFDARWIFRVVVQLLAQTRNAGINGAVQTVKTDAAQFLQQIVTRQHVAGMRGKEPEQVEFGGGEVNVLAAQAGGAGTLADAEVAEDQLVAGVVLLFLFTFYN